MVKYEIYLKHRKFPNITTKVICDNCGHTINAGQNYKPNFCDMCGEHITDDLNKVDWRYEDVTYYEYFEYLLENNPDLIIKKIKWEKTDYGRMGLPYDETHIPVICGNSMEEILEFINNNSANRNIYSENDLENATKEELLRYGKICGKYWTD